ncbi:hypothetical protein DPMN_170810 [Dreissena polymorpha]|uniref:Uncharacterized protein n=1 Tax=Dreissena polymorpha TaxID=45954 RepID=A0A9D4IEL0_DREPO|nr:hypothetical protein DPMN_170810 [Dreissena polymorpha]
MKIRHQFFELSPGIIGTNVLTKFHEDRTRNVASRVFTRQNVDDERRTDDGQKATQKLTMSTLCSGELKTNVQTKFHKDWTINVTTRVLTRFNYSGSHISKTALCPGRHVFLPI